MQCEMKLLVTRIGVLQKVFLLLLDVAVPPTRALAFVAEFRAAAAVVDEPVADLGHADARGL